MLYSTLDKIILRPTCGKNRFQKCRTVFTDRIFFFGKTFKNHVLWHEKITKRSSFLRYVSTCCQFFWPSINYHASSRRPFLRRFSATRRLSGGKFFNAFVRKIMRRHDGQHIFFTRSASGFYTVFGLVLGNRAKNEHVTMDVCNRFSRGEPIFDLKLFFERHGRSAFFNFKTVLRRRTAREIARHTGPGRGNSGCLRIRPGARELTRFNWMKAQYVVFRN